MALRPLSPDGIGRVGLWKWSHAKIGQTSQVMLGQMNNVIDFDNPAGDVHKCPHLVSGLKLGRNHVNLARQVG